MSLCSLLSPRSGFRCCCAAPPPPAQPHQEALGGLEEPRNARGGEKKKKKKTLFNFPPPCSSAPCHPVAPQPNKVRRGWSPPLADRRREPEETRAGAGEVHPRRLPVVSSILYVQHYNLQAIVQMGLAPSTFCSFRLAKQTDRFVFERGSWMGLGKAAGKVRLKVSLKIRIK